MARRSKDWNVGLAQDLRDANFAREFLLAAIEGRIDSDRPGKSYPGYWDKRVFGENKNRKSKHPACDQSTP